MAENITLQAQKRTVFGRKVKKLRNQGLIPANIYGSKVDSLAVSLNHEAFINIFKKAGETQIVSVTVDDEKTSRPTLITKVQSDPISRQFLHIDLRQVNLKEKITAAVDIELIGESPAEAAGAVIVTLKNQLEVEALPTDLPEKLTIDISKLEKIGDAITVNQINIDPNKVTILGDSEEIVVKAEEKQQEEVEEAPVEVETTGETTPASEEKPAESAEQA
jgi:large subunit ribosomal protein L25